MSRSTFYYHLKKSALPDKYGKIKEEIYNIYHANKGSYEYRQITLALRNRAIIVNHKTVQRLMKELGIKCMIRIKKYRSYKGEVGKIAPNIIKRDFCTDCPNEKWTMDLTEFALFGSKIYLSPIFDMYSGEIISYSISNSTNLNQVINMLDETFSKFENLNGLIFHSDQGWQYQHSCYQQRLRDKGIIQSMSRKGNCLDNSVMEIFFGLLKSELLYLQEFNSIDHFKEELTKYIEHYNNDRIKIKLKSSPIDYRLKYSVCA